MGSYLSRRFFHGKGTKGMQAAKRPFQLCLVDLGQESKLTDLLQRLWKVSIFDSTTLFHERDSCTLMSAGLCRL